MGSLRHRLVVWLILVIPLAATACSALASTPSTATPIPTVDTNAILEAVLTEVEARFVQPTVTPAPTVDADGISAAVLEEVKEKLIQPTVTAAPTVTPMPTVDANQVAQAVLADVQVQSALAAVTADLEDALISLYQQANPAVVSIIVKFLGSGSGFVYGQDGYIVTNNHVVEGGRDYEVVFANGERQRGELVGADADSDLAVIKVEELPEGVGPLPLATPDTLQVGQFVVTIGNPFGEQGSMSLGIVSGLGRSLSSQRASSVGVGYSLPQVIQTDAPINPGNSGGPLLNLDGTVVGVNAAIATRTGTNSGVGFSIPVAAVHRIVPSLIEKGAYVYPYVGAGFENEITLDKQVAFGLSQTRGAYVINVDAGGPAAEAGLIAANRVTGRGGDLIVDIDGRPIGEFSDLNSYLVFGATVGQTIEITVLRDSERIVLPLTLGARP